MEYRHLGKTGLKVSAISLGFMITFEQEAITSIVKAAYDAGINFFDNAEYYGFPENGKVESLFGNALKELKIPRENIVVSTKIFWGNAKNPNGVGLSRKHVIEGTRASLKRLQLDYVDLILAHRFDPETPLEETCRAFSWLVDQGLALYWGTSMWPAKKIAEAIGICKALNLHCPVVEQPEYSMLVRDKIESEYVDLFDQYGIGTTVWGPLCSGILTGKYNKEVPKDSRYETIDPMWKPFFEKYLGKDTIDNTRKMMLELEKIAGELGCTQAQLALAWVIKNKDVSTALLGATKISQLEENLKALQFVDKITTEVEEKISKVLNNTPQGEIDFRSWKPKQPRRP